MSHNHGYQDPINWKPLAEWASLGFPSPSFHLHTGMVQAPIPLLQTGNAACLPTPKLFPHTLKECLVVLIIPTKVKCSNTSSHPWAALDRKHSLYPGCSVACSHGGASWWESRMCQRDAGASEGAAHGERSQGSPGFPSKGPELLWPTNPFPHWFLIHMMQTQSRVAVTESFRLEKTLKIINSKHKFSIMSLAPSMMPYNQNMPAIPWWKTGSQPISDHTQVWKKSLSKPWMKLQLNTSSSVPASHAWRDTARIYPHMKAHSAEFNWIHSKISALFLHQ